MTRGGGAGLMDGSKETGARVRRIARDVLGFAVLRPAQLEAAAALAAGRDCLAVLPSGAGKSAIYQIAAVALGGPVVVVSPLLALQREQADALRARGLSAVTVNGLSGRSAQQDADALLGSGRAGFIFLGPEQLARDDVRAQPDPGAGAAGRGGRGALHRLVGPRLPSRLPAVGRGHRSVPSAARGGCADRDGRATGAPGDYRTARLA